MAELKTLREARLAREAAEKAEADNEEVADQQRNDAENDEGPGKDASEKIIV